MGLCAPSFESMECVDEGGAFSVLERQTEVPARLLLVGVALGRRGEILDQEELASLAQKEPGEEGQRGLGLPF